MEHVDAFIKSGTYLRNWSPRTVRTYRQAFASLQRSLQLQAPADLKGPAALLTKARLEAWVAWLRSKGVTPGGVNMYVRTVNSYLSWKHEEGLSGQRLRLKLLPDPKGPMDHLTDADLRLVMNHRAAGRNARRTQALVALLADTGLRISEALGVESSRVDLDGLSLQVVGKGGRARLVPFSLGARKALWRHVQDSRRDGVPGRYVFATASGAPLSYRNAYRDIKSLCASAGVEGARVHPHAFRHYFAVGYVRNGGDLYRLSRILGHQSISTTQVYLRSMGLEQLREGHSQFSPLARL